ncbi:MAG: hypothetical protein MUP55_02600, partial [Candidatus Aenigmarchaeota archaeon]|nr:hypothetical protein [Candidatus Aenigmarchaeota archaeon]
GQGFNGTIDEIRVWNRTLSADEILAIYNSTRSYFSSEEVPSLWANDSWFPMTGTQNWSNVTKFVNSTVGANIAWKFYANDSDNQWNSTSVFNYTTTAPTLSWSANSTNSTTAGTWIEHRLKWDSEMGLSGYIFSFYNGSNTSQTTLSTDLEGGTQTSLGRGTWLNTGIKVPSSNAVVSGAWGSPANMYSDNAVRAFANITNLNHSWYGFATSVPDDAGNNITMIRGIVNILQCSRNASSGTVTAAIQLSNNSGASWSPTENTASYSSTTDANITTGSGTNLWGLTWNSTTANALRVKLNSNAVPSGNQLRCDVMWINVSYETTDTEYNSSAIYYNNTALAIYPQINSLNVTVSVSNYGSLGSTARGNNNPDLKLSMWNGTTMLYVGSFGVSATGNKSITTTNAGIITAWATQNSRNMSIQPVYLDYFNSTYNDNVSWDQVWIQPTSTTDMINDSWLAFTGTANWSNVTKFVNLSGGATIKWCIYANDSLGNWNGTSCQNPFSYVTTGGADTTPPNLWFTSPSSNQSTVSVNWLFVNVSANESLNACLLDWYNGSWQNVSMTPTGSYCCKNMTGLLLGSYYFRVYGNDTAGN